MRAPVPPPLKRFIWDIQSMVELAESEREILVIGRVLMARLVASDDWLPDDFAVPDKKECQQYLLYGDGLERFSVVSTVFHGGQTMPVCQDRVWEIRGLLRGSRGAQHFPWEPGSAPRPKGDAKLVKSGSVDVVSPKNGESRRERFHQHSCLWGRHRKDPSSCARCRWYGTRFHPRLREPCRFARL